MGVPYQPRAAPGLIFSNLANLVLHLSLSDPSTHSLTRTTASAGRTLYDDSRIDLHEWEESYEAISEYGFVAFQNIKSKKHAKQVSQGLCRH